MKNRVIIQWHITHRCNLRCTHCYQNEYDSDLGEEKMQEIFQKIVSYLQETDSVGHINLTGGEPFCSPFFWNILKWLQQEKRIKSFGLLTNGTLLSREAVNELSKLEKLSFVQISLDGDRKMHDAIRGEGNFELAANALKQLQHKKIQTMVSFTAGKENYQALEEVVNVCKKLKVDRLWTDRVVPIGPNGKCCQKQLMSQEEFHWYIAKLYELYEREKKSLLSHLTIHTNRALQFMGNCNELGGYHCGAGKNLLVILADGSLMPCRRMEIVYGNLFDSSIGDLLVKNQEKTEEIHCIPTECKACRHVDKCRGGARCMTYAVHGDLNHKDPNCPL